MSHYKRILVGLDLSAESQQVIDHVKALFAGKDSKISLVHVQEPLSFAYGGDIPMDLSEIQNQLETQATQRLAELRGQLADFEVDTHVIIGQPASEMHRFAREHGVDLIVVGTHGRHGLALIFGSTANGILHGATCDVLAVRIKESKDKA
ncbi:MAG: universal stress protein [Porticoccaceae bacterium]|jgi:universal stress protein A|nr:universal stress protein [Porticoccaceae bacterium]MEA3299236.1 universal stress protein [Pseudomonadota bacterium]HLS97589.1 universal stress protein [Porticoccaceae bacterium]